MKNASSMIATYRSKKQEVWRRPGLAGINGTTLRLSPGQGLFVFAHGQEKLGRITWCEAQQPIPGRLRARAANHSVGKIWRRRGDDRHRRISQRAKRDSGPRLPGSRGWY